MPNLTPAQVIMHDEGHLAHLAALFNDTKYADMVLVAEAPVEATEPSCSAGSSAFTEHGMHQQQQQPAQPERRRFFCHRAILASRSTYFDRMFGSGVVQVLSSLERFRISQVESLMFGVWGSGMGSVLAFGPSL